MLRLTDKPPFTRGTNRSMGGVIDDPAFASWQAISARSTSTPALWAERTIALLEDDGTHGLWVGYDSFNDWAADFWPGELPWEESTMLSVLHRVLNHPEFERIATIWATRLEFDIRQEIEQGLAEWLSEDTEQPVAPEVVKRFLAAPCPD